MRKAVRLLVIGLLLSALAAGAEPAGCGVSKGLYDGWLTLAKHVPRPAKGDSLVAGSSNGTAEPDKRQAIGKEYHAFFQCLADTAERQDKDAVAARCKEAEGDRLATLVCRTAMYVKGGRSDSKEFMDALPAGKKGAEMVWDLQEIAGGKEESGSSSLFLPSGPAYKLIDELFLLVLDDRDTAAAKYFNIAANAPSEVSRHVDDQMKLLLRESPAVVVKRWMILRQYQPKLKKLLTEMSASLPPAEMQKMRKGLGSFCSRDNPDCPEIVKLFGRPD